MSDLNYTMRVRLEAPEASGLPDISLSVRVPVHSVSDEIQSSLDRVRSLTSDYPMHDSEHHHVVSQAIQRILYQRYAPQIFEGIASELATRGLGPRNNLSRAQVVGVVRTGLKP